MNIKLYDADAHVVEPPDVWQARVPAKLKALAPKVVKKDNGSDAWSFEDGKRVSTLGMLLATPGVSPVRWTLEQLKTRLPSMVAEAGYADIAKAIDQQAIAQSLSLAEKDIFAKL